MIAALYPLLVLFCFQDDPRVLRWPLGDGTQAFPLLRTYGQLQGDSDAASLHFGLDIIAKKPGELVRAIEKGVVKRVLLGDTEKCPVTEEYYSGIVVESAGVTGRALLYLHLDPCTIKVKEGYSVAPGQELGYVILKDTKTGVEHLHLSRLGGDYVGHKWEGLDSLSVSNPLVLLDPKLLHDSTAPEVQLIRTRLCRPRENEDAYGGYHKYPSPSHIQPGDLDLLVRIYDRDDSGSTHLLAPHRITLKELENGDSRELFLDGSLSELQPEDLYNLDEERPSFSSVGETPGRRYRYFFVATNEKPGSTTEIDTTHFWSATTGSHEFELTVLDVAGNLTTETFTIDVESPN